MPIFLLAQHAQRIVEFVVTDCHRVVTHQVHAAEVRLGVLQIRFRHAGVDIAARQQQQAAALRRHFLTNAVHQRFLRAQAVFAVIVLPEVTVMIVGVQNGDGVGLILSQALAAPTATSGNGQRACGGFQRKRMANLRVLNGFYDEGEIVARINDS